MVRHVIAAAILFVATLFALLAVLGVARSKNGFAALHCAAVVSVMVPPLALVAVLVDTGIGIPSLKMAVLTAIVLAGGPIASHAIAVAEHRRRPQ